MNKPKNQKTGSLPKRKRASPRIAMQSDEAASVRKKWNIPNWKNIKEYKYIKTLKGDRLRWEFLRRDEAYRKNWDKTPKPTMHFLLGKYLSPTIRGSKLPKDFLFEDSKRRGLALGLRPPPIQHLLVRQDEKHNLLHADSKVYAYIGKQVLDLSEEGFLLIAFDPARPPKQQIKDAKKRLAEARENFLFEHPELSIRRKSNLKDPIKLLRALDAVSVGASNNEIGFYLYGIESYEKSISTAQQNLERAKKYWRIL